VAGQSWYYDFSGSDGGRLNNIYLAANDDPNSHTVGLGNTPHAFRGTASNITIKNLIIEKYAAPIESGAIVVDGPYWLLRKNEIRLNHGEGITDLLGGDYVQVLSNNVHNNRETGVQGPGSDGLWDSNVIAYNNADHIDPNYEGNGSKWEGSHVTISNNVSHDNNGVGLFCDAGAVYRTDREQYRLQQPQRNPVRS
jgi:hypothetical protein